MCINIHLIFMDVMNVCSSVEMSIEIPRRASKQTKRDNYGTEDLEAYYRLAIYNP